MDHSQRESEPSGYQAVIEQWSRCTWHVTYRLGLMEFEPGDFAFTQRRAERKAQRTMAKMRAADERYKKRYVVIPTGAAQPPNPPPPPRSQPVPPKPPPHVWWPEQPSGPAGRS